MAKHTPGPWDLDDYNNANFIIRDKSGEYVTTVTKSRYHDNRKDERAEANALLIATAPEILDEMKNLVELLGNADEATVSARALIARIEKN